jgi:hypothetical protein
MHVLIVGNDHVRTRHVGKFVKAALPDLEVEYCHFVHHFEWMKDRRNKHLLILSDNTCALRSHERPDVPVAVPYTEPKLFAGIRNIHFIGYSRLGTAGPIFRIKLALFGLARRLRNRRKPG